MRKEINIFLLVLFFISSALLVSAQDNKSKGGSNMNAPKGAQSNQVGNVKVIESRREYTFRQIDNLGARLSNVEAKLEELKRQQEQLRMAVEAIKKNSVSKRELEELKKMVSELAKNKEIPHDVKTHPEVK